ncbi:MAG TPA: hypothetical protein VGC42_06910 [Kofleriaceae bacterium]
MVKTLWLSLGAVAALGACSTDNSTSLNDLSKTFGETHVEIFANNQVNLLLHIDGDGCATLGDDVVATYDGQPMAFSSGGYAEDSTGCYPIAFWVRDFPATQIGNRERASGAADIVIRDASASWRIAPTQLFGNDLEIDAATSSIVWPNVDHISTMSTLPYVNVQIDQLSSSVKYPAGTSITFAAATAHPIPTVCAGPGRCTVDMSRARDFSKVSPQ